MDSTVASLLLSAEMEDFEEIHDSDDCSSDSDEASVEDNSFGFTTENPVEDDGGTDEEPVDYHKMTKIDDREYQRELLELAKKLNVIICLPTGSGKTFIALQLINHLLPSAIKKNRKIVFVANTIPLVHQQALYFSKNLVNTALKDDNIVRALTGDLNVDFWEKEEWKQVLNSCHILVMSTQILLDAIKYSFIKWSQICLLILDECHHAQKNHAMANLMKKYGERREKGDKDLPKVLGLTATIIAGNSQVEHIPREIKDIESLLCCKAVTHRNYEDVLRHSTNSKFEPIPFKVNYTINDNVCKDVIKLIKFLGKLPKNVIPDDGISQLVANVDHPSLVSDDQIFKKRESVPDRLAAFLSDMLRMYEDLGPFGGKMAAVIKLRDIKQWIEEIEFSDDNNNMNDEEITDIDDKGPEESVSLILLLQMVQTTVVWFLHNLTTLMERFTTSVGKSEDAEAYQVRYLVSDKIQQLWNILKTTRPNDGASDKDKLCGIVFCERRITAHVLRWYLEMAAKHWPTELGFVKTDVIMGHSGIVRDISEARFTAKRQSYIIQKFHAKELNLLIATNVVEEGLNVPSCNLVVRFDPITSYPSFVQSLGRARRRGAKSYALINSLNATKQVNKLRKYVVYNEKLAEALQQNVLHVGDELEKDKQNMNIPIPPFRPYGDDGPEIAETDAISLIHRYCSSLGCDKIAVLTPYSWWERCKKGGSPRYKAYVQLPTLSPVKENIVEGPPMASKTLAKRAAFMEACKQLFCCGELTENLVPKSRSIDDFQCDFLDCLDNEYENEKGTCLSKMGTRKRVQWYSKKTEMESEIIAGQPVSLYKINIQLANYRDDYDPQVRQLYEFQKYSQFYGILTTVNLDGLPSFPLHAIYGTYYVTIQKVKVKDNSNGDEVVLSEGQMQSLRSFQLFLRDSVYNVKHPLLQMDSKSAYLVAPISSTTEDPNLYEIQWNLIPKLLGIDKEALINPPDEGDRQKTTFSESAYNNALLVPWYKDDKSEAEFLCAINILTDTSSQSAFSDEKFSSFEDYFSQKYRVLLYHPESPLIHCKDVGKQLNFLAKKVDPKILRKEIQRSAPKMIPELVNIHPLPASLYIQGRLLPSVFHRVMRLLVANELRMAVAAHFDWDVTSVDNVDLDMFGKQDEGDSLDLGLADLSISERKKKKQKLPMKRNFVCLDDINPFDISLELINQSKRMGGKSWRDKNYVLPLPVRWKSKVVEDFIATDNFNFPSFDAKTDFDKENGPNIFTIMEALTLLNGQDHISLEKLEVMGDSVLKLIVSLHLLRTFFSWDEGKLTMMRTKLISNLHLYQLGSRRDIGKILSGCLFYPQENWLPWGSAVPKNVEDFIVSKNFKLNYDTFLFRPLSMIESISDEEIENILNNQKIAGGQSHVNYTHSQINDKSVADAMEAVIGAYYTNGGIDSAFRIMEWLGLQGPMMDGTSQFYSRQTTLTPMEFNNSRKSGKPNWISLLKDLEEVLNYKFKDPWLAVEALTHPTFFTNRDTPPYERLEFVGDAILDFLVTDYIIKNTGITDPGKVTDLRAALVNNVTFGCLAVRYGFHIHLKHCSKPLADFISKFVEYQEDNKHQVSNPFKLLSDFDCATVQEIEVPKVLGDIFESIAGAIFVDSGMSIDQVWRVYYRLMKFELEKFSKNIPKSPLRELYEKFPEKVKFRKVLNDGNHKNSTSNAYPSRYQEVVLQVPLNGVTKSIHGMGSTVKQAKQAAAKYVMKKLQEEDKFNCERIK